MAISNTLLQSTLVAISPTGITSPSGQPKDIATTVLFFCNLNTVDPDDSSSGLQFVDIHVVPAGDVADSRNKIANQVPIDAGDTFTFNTEKLILSFNDRIFARTTNNNQVSATISYVVI